MEEGRKGEGERGGKWEEKEKKGRKNAKRGNKASIELELFNFRYHWNCYWDLVNKLQINTGKRTCDHTSSDKATLSYVLKSRSNKENKIWNTNELVDANRNTGIYTTYKWSKEHMRPDKFCQSTLQLYSEDHIKQEKQAWTEMNY